MRKKEVIAAGIVILIAAIFLSGCVEKKPATSADYFPAKAGMEWSYKVDFGTANPKIYQTINSEIYEGSIDSKKAEKIPECCRLSFITQDMDVFPSNGTVFLKLNIIRDDLGLLGTESTWGISRDGEDLDVFGSIDYPRSKNKDGMQDQESKPVIAFFGLRILFFTPHNEGEEKGASDGNLTFIGYDFNVSGYEGIKSMHFGRSISSIDVTEDTWYVPGKGLVRLEQKIDGEPSMTWTLESFKTS